MVKSEKKVKEPDLKKISELSNHLSKKFRFRKACKYCWGRGINTMQFTANSDFVYVPCSCVKAI